MSTFFRDVIFWIKKAGGALHKVAKDVLKWTIIDLYRVHGGPRSINGQIHVLTLENPWWPQIGDLSLNKFLQFPYRREGLVHYGKFRAFAKWCG